MRMTWGGYWRSSLGRVETHARHLDTVLTGDLHRCLCPGEMGVTPAMPPASCEALACSHWPRPQLPLLWGGTTSQG